MSKAIKPKGKPGRPTKYSPELGERIAKQYGDGRTLQEIADAEGISRMSIWQWQTENRGGFSDLLARARGSRAGALVEKASQVLEDVDLDTLEDARKANAYVNLAERKAAHARWTAERLDPAWSERQRVDITTQATQVVLFGGLSHASPIQARAEVETPSGRGVTEDRGEEPAGGS